MYECSSLFGLGLNFGLVYSYIFGGQVCLKNLPHRKIMYLSLKNCVGHFISHGYPYLMEVMV